MCDEWMPTFKWALSWEQFERLPRNSAYRYEYLDGLAYLSPRPKHYHALLDLTAAALPEEPQPFDAAEAIRPLHSDDWPELEVVFRVSFAMIQPFGSLDDATLQEASIECLRRTRTGFDGPLLSDASFVAVHDRHVVGAALITLVPGDNPCDSSSYRWQDPPPADCVAARLGNPHLTWIFVTPILAGKGIGSGLLKTVRAELLRMGYTQLLSTFVLGNDSSMMWHWRNGFQLLEFPGSYRRKESRRKKRESSENV